MLRAQEARGAGGRASSKITGLTERAPYGDRPEMRTLFSYDPEAGSVSPSDPRKAVAAGARLGRAAGLLGIPGTEADVWRRAALLRECMSRGARGIGGASGYYGVSDPGAAFRRAGAACRGHRPAAPGQSRIGPVGLPGRKGPAPLQAARMAGPASGQPGQLRGPVI